MATKKVDATMRDLRADIAAADERHRAIDERLRKDGVRVNERLDADVRQVGAAGERAAAELWEIGAVVLRVSEERLWRGRLENDGNHRYKSFDAFAVQELGMSGEQATALAEFARRFTKGEAGKAFRALGIRVRTKAGAS